MSKGDKGYIAFEQKKTVILTIIMYALGIGIYFLGYFTLHTNKSLWTVIAVLSVLPASKSAVRMIMLLRARSTPEHLYEEVAGRAEGLFTLYDLIFTTYEKTFVARALVYKSANLCLYTEDTEGARLQGYLMKTLKAKSPELSVKVYSEKDAFLKRVSEMSERLGQAEEAEPTFFETIRAIVI